MDNKKFLNEERYQKNKKKVVVAAIMVLIVGILVGGSLIATGLKKQNDVNSNYSEENKQSLQEKINQEKQKLETKKAELKAKGIEYDEFAEYDDGESYDLKVITKSLDPGFNNCGFDECKNNPLTSTYCSYTQQLNNMTDFKKKSDSFDSIPFFMFGGMAILIGCIIAGRIYMFAKRREIAAFTTQQVMPIAKEGIDEIAPNIGNVAREISKGINDEVKNDKESL